MTDASVVVEGFLSHHGVKGMKWGIRKAGDGGSSSKTPREVKVTTKHDPSGRVRIKTSGGSHHPAHTDAILAKVASQKLKRSGMDSLSNEELTKLTTRLNLEQQTKRLRSGSGNAASKFVSSTLQSIAKQQVASLANKAASDHMEKVLKGTVRQK